MEIYKLFAQYNRAFNARLREIFDIHPNAVSEPILEQLNHLAVMDIVWISRLADAQHADSERSMDAVLFVSAAAWWPIRDSIDCRIESLVGDASSYSPERPIEFVTKADGVKVTCKWHHALAHLFNHQSLHRGEILRLLGDQGIEFGNADLLPFIIRPAQYSA